MTDTLRIGVTIFPPKSGMSPWSCGAHANVYFLAHCLRHCEGVASVVLINGGDGEPPAVEDTPAPLRDIPFVRMADIADSIDVLIQAGAQVSAADVEAVHARGGRAVAYKFGADYQISAEWAIHKMPTGSIFNGARWDEIWTTPQHEETCGSYWETVYRCPVRVLPHIWDPMFVDLMTATFPEGLQVGYRPGRAKKRIVIAEPNIQVIKNCMIPMLIAEQAWRMRRELIDRVYVTNALALKESPVFQNFAANLDICKATASDGLPVCSFEARFATPWFLSAHGDVLVSHQWYPAWNYLLYDAMHLGFPVVHNVPTDEVLHEYSGNEIDWGASALIAAMTESARTAATRDGVQRNLLRNHAATAPHNIAAHARAIANLVAS